MLGTAGRAEHGGKAAYAGRELQTRFDLPVTREFLQPGPAPQSSAAAGREISFGRGAQTVSARGNPGLGCGLAAREGKCFSSSGDAGKQGWDSPLGTQPQLELKGMVDSPLGVTGADNAQGGAGAAKE